VTTLSKFCCAIAVLSAPLLAAQDQQAINPSQPIVLRADRLIDGRHDSEISAAVVIVEGGKITAVGSRLPMPAGAQVIDLGDATLLPGLIDAHTHLLYEVDMTNGNPEELETLKIVATQSTAERALFGAKSAREDLEAGITTVRDLGNSGVNGDLALRNAIDKGWMPGPRIVAATRALAAPGGQFGPLTPEAQALIEQEYVTINGPDSARQAVRQAIYNGADCIKVIINSTASVTPDEMKAIVEEAHVSGVKVAAHATRDKAARIAAEAGVDSIEHGYKVSDDVLRMMAQKHIFLVPTDHTAQAYSDMLLSARVLTPDERKREEEWIKSFVAGNGERLQRAIKLGVPIAAGSDDYAKLPNMNRGQGSLDTLAAYADEGMAPMAIIRAATSSASELLGLQDHIGTLEVGKFADIIAVPGDPLKEVASLERATFVMKGGVVIKGVVIKNEK
jgi:imidazolonepropionase-like amidohydrolase